MKALLKGLARGLSAVAVAPALISFAIRSGVMGRDRALVGSAQALSLVPGLIGQYLRRAFLARALTGGCGRSAVIEFGVLLSRADSQIDEGVYIGPRCHLGRVHLEPNVLLASGVHIPSGPHSHGTDLSAPIHDQPGALRRVRIGAGSWIGSGAIVMADVGRNTIVGAGAVVTAPLPDHVVAAGVPARIVRRLNHETSVPA
jgi:virginiamycin A acetyltransferase